MMNGLNILVTGSEGFIGKSLCEAILIQFSDINIIGVGRSRKQENKCNNFQYISCDLQNDDILSLLPKEVDVIIHLAGDGRSFINPTNYTSQIDANILMTSLLADYAVSTGVKLIIYASSVYVYSGCQAPFREKIINLPTENLGASKLGSESLLKSRSLVGQFKSICLRIFTVYGPNSSAYQFIPEAIMKIQSSEPEVTFCSPNIKRDFIFIDDVVKAIISSIGLIDSNINSETFNVGTGISTSIKKIIGMLMILLDSNKTINYIPNNQQNNLDITHIADISYIEDTIGWHPEIPLEVGLRKTIENYM